MSASNFTSNAQGWDLGFLGGLTSSNPKELKVWEVKAHLRSFYIILEEFLILMKSNFIIFFLLWFVLFVSYWKKFCLLLLQNSLWFLWELTITFRPMIHFRLIFVNAMRLPFHFVDLFFAYRGFLVWCSLTCLFLLLLAVLLVPYPRNHWQDQHPGDFPLYSSGSFMVSGLTVKSLNYFEFIFMYGII